MPFGNVDNGSAWVAEIGNRVIQDGKSAAPMTVATKSRMVNGVYPTGTFSDFSNLGWDKTVIRVNTGSAKGVNVNDLPASADVRWERNWNLGDTSSPVLLRDSKTSNGVGINYYLQPYHLFTDNTPLTKNDNPSKSLKWLPMMDNGSASAAVNTWIGFDLPTENERGWEDTQRQLNLRFFTTSTYQKTWNLTPQYRVTATFPVTVSQVTSFNVDNDGVFSPNFSTVTEQKRSSYTCSGEKIAIKVVNVVN